MSTFSEFITKCTTRADYKSTRTDTYLKESTVRKLKEVSVIRALFMEGQFTITTTEDQAEYTTGYSGFPNDLMELDALYGVSGTAPNTINYLVDGPISLEEARAARYSNFNQPYPEFWAWHNDSLILVPTPSTSTTVVTGDYMADATRDTATGDAITTTSTTHTNGWFDRGEQILMNMVMYEYHLAISKDVEAAAMAKTLVDDGLESLRREIHLKQYKGGQSRAIFDNSAGPYWWF